MIKKIYAIALVTLIGGVIFTSCQSTAGKTDAAGAKVKDAKEDLKQTRKDAEAEAQRAVTEEEWITFRNQSQERIWANERRIADMKTQMNRPGKLLDASYSKWIDSLEENNKDMKRKMESYEKSQKGWDKFKRDYNHEMDELEKAFTDIPVNNTK